jgi:hypothetical protein
MRIIVIFASLLIINSVMAQGNVERTRGFLSSLLNLGSPPQVGQCTGEQRTSARRFNPPENFREVRLNCQSSRLATYQGQTLSILTLEQAQTLFQELQSIDYLPMKYLEDGCYARAHEIALIAQENGLHMGKAFLHSPENGELLYPQTLRNQNPPRFSHNFTGWSYHATPFLLVEQPDGRILPTVFDLGVASGPQTFDQWRSNLHDQPRTTRLEVRERDYVFDYGSFRSPGVSIIDRLQETESLIDDLGWNEYMFRLEQGWL